MLGQPVLLVTLLFSLSACGSREVKTGSLIQRFTMVDSDGRQFGVVEMDPVNGGSVTDISGRLVGRITPPNAATTVTANNLAPLPQTGYMPY